MRFESRPSHSSSYSSSGYAGGDSGKNPGLRRVFSDIVMIAFWGFSGSAMRQVFDQA